MTGNEKGNDQCGHCHHVPVLPAGGVAQTKNMISHVDIKCRLVIYANNELTEHAKSATVKSIHC